MNDKLNDLVSILAARSGLDTAGDIDSIRAHLSNAFSNVLRGQSACQDNPVTSLYRFSSNLPVKCLPAAAVNYRGPGIKQTAGNMIL